MPSYVSLNGKFYPAKEHVVLPHLSGTPNEIYDGPDRAAEFELAQAHGVEEEGPNKGKPKETTFGEDFHKNVDLINLARQLGFKDVDEYARATGWTPESSEKIFKAKAAEIVKHIEPSKKVEVTTVGGGRDYSGEGNDMLGGFGKEKLKPANK